MVAGAGPVNQVAITRLTQVYTPPTRLAARHRQLTPPTVDIMVAATTDELGVVETDARSSLLPFIDLDRAGAVAGLVTVMVANGVFLRVDGVWLVVPFLVGLTMALTLARREAAAERPQASLAWITAGNWVVAAAVALLFPFLWPLMIMTVLMPLVLASPLLRPGQVWPAVGATSMAVGTVALIGLLNDDGGVLPDLADELELLTVAVGLAGHIVPIGAVIAHSNRLQTTSIQQSIRLNRRLLAAQADLSESRRRIVHAQDAERQRIERDLHDGAQQRLVALALRLRLLESLVSDDSPIRRNLEQLVAELDGAVEELRELAHGIYPPVLQTRGLAEALRSVARRSAGTVGVKVNADDVGRLDQSVETALYYVALEAVANAMKHAPGMPIEVDLTLDSDEVTLQVADGGSGFDPDQSARSSGLVNMGDRISAIGGRFDIDSAPGSPTTVTATAPIGEPLPTQV